MNLRALQQFTDEIFGQNRHTDSMNDYYPHTLYLDTEQGTYGDASRIQLISTTDWTQEDCDTWETMTDSLIFRATATTIIITVGVCAVTVGANAGYLWWATMLISIYPFIHLAYRHKQARR